jgi:hypothetical protein
MEQEQSIARTPVSLMTLWNNLRYAARQLRKSPAFTTTTILTLGLCVGANTAIYTLVDTLFFRPLPYPHPERLIMVTTVFQKGGASGTQTSQTGSQWEPVRDQASFLDAAVYGSAGGVNLFAAGRVEYVQQHRVSANYFHVLGISPLIGREFLRQEDVPGGPPVTVLSYGLWRRVFHGEPGIVGRAIDLRGAPFTVVGVMPPGFRTDVPADLWTPLRPSPTGEGEGSNYSIIGRLKPGATFVAANGQLNAIMQSVFKDRHLPAGVSVQEKAIPLQAGLTTDIHSNIEVMWAFARNCYQDRAGCEPGTRHRTIACRGHSARDWRWPTGAGYRATGVEVPSLAESGTVHFLWPTPSGRSRDGCDARGCPWDQYSVWPFSRT